MKRHTCFSLPNLSQKYAIIVLKSKEISIEKGKHRFKYMTIFDVLSLIGGLCLFLFGMNIMGEALERRVGGQLQNLLAKLTTNKLAGLLTGIGVTSIIQSSSATTVMVVGFVNSGLMTLKQAINVIMGANIGTTITAWILSLGGIQSDSFFMQLLKPTSFTPILALAGIILYMFLKDPKKKDTGMIFLGFAVLMFGMDTMTQSVSGLAEMESFQNLFLLFKNPILGVLVGALLTAIVQSSSASVGILQALAMTGAVTYSAAIPIIMGQNIGTCITAILSSFGTNRNAKRAAIVHLSFNVVGTLVWISIFMVVQSVVQPPILNASATLAGIAISHTLFNLACTILLLPLSGVLEKIAYILVPETPDPETFVELDERLLQTPTLALEQCNNIVAHMAELSVDSIQRSIHCIFTFDKEDAKKIRKTEDRIDRYEDKISEYLIQLSILKTSESDSTKAAMLLKAISDFERMSDHATNILQLAEEMHEKKCILSNPAKKELENLSNAIYEIMHLTLLAFQNQDIQAAEKVEPLEEIIDEIKDRMRNQHILRLQDGQCTAEYSFLWNDILTNLERTSDHCSNVAASIIDIQTLSFHIHQSIRSMKKNNPAFKKYYEEYAEKYLTTRE